MKRARIGHELAAVEHDGEGATVSAATVAPFFCLICLPAFSIVVAGTQRHNQTTPDPRTNSCAAQSSQSLCSPGGPVLRKGALSMKTTNEIPTGRDSGNQVHALRFAYYGPGGDAIYRPNCESVASGNARETGEKITCRKCLSLFSKSKPRALAMLALLLFSANLATAQNPNPGRQFFRPQDAFSEWATMQIAQKAIELTDYNEAENAHYATMANPEYQSYFNAQLARALDLQDMAVGHPYETEILDQIEDALEDLEVANGHFWGNLGCAWKDHNRSVTRCALAREHIENQEWVAALDDAEHADNRNLPDRIHDEVYGQSRIDKARNHLDTAQYTIWGSY